MSLPTIVFLDRATIPEHIEIPRPSFQHHWREYDLTAPEQRSLAYIVVAYG